MSIGRNTGKVTKLLRLRLTSKPPCSIMEE